MRIEEGTLKRQKVCERECGKANSGEKELDREWERKRTTEKSVRAKNIGRENINTDQEFGYRCACA